MALWWSPDEAAPPRERKPPCQTNKGLFLDYWSTMEQVKPKRGPGEMFCEDPAALRSPEATGLETFIDMQMNIKLMKKSDSPDSEALATLLEATDEATDHIIADEAAVAAGPGGRVVCIACPGVYMTLKKVHTDHKNDLFIDFDPRFKDFGDNTLIIPLDGEKPLESIEYLPPRYHHAFKVVVVDTIYLDFLSLDRVLDAARRLSSLHEPLKVILIAPEAAKEKAAVLGLHLAKLRPHGRHGANVRVYTSIPNSKRLY